MWDLKTIIKIGKKTKNKDYELKKVLKKKLRGWDEETRKVIKKGVDYEMELFHLGRLDIITELQELLKQH